MTETSAEGVRATGVRARARAELTREIKAVAREHLARDGAAGLSLRAVARDLGMVSSAVYRYFPSRDDLLTALIVDAYDAFGAAAEDADARCARDDHRGRFRAVWQAVRDAALASPHEFALVYGSPVPGYAAPQDTIGPAARVGVVLGAIVADAARAGVLSLPDAPPLPRAVRQGVATVGEGAMPDAPPELVVRGIMAWTHLFGALGFELFGHRNNVVGDYGAFFAVEVERMADFVGLPTGRGRPRGSRGTAPAPRR